MSPFRSGLELDWLAAKPQASQDEVEVPVWVVVERPQPEPDRDQDQDRNCSYRGGPHDVHHAEA